MRLLAITLCFFAYTAGSASAATVTPDVDGTVTQQANGVVANSFANVIFFGFNSAQVFGAKEILKILEFDTTGLSGTEGYKLTFDSVAQPFASTCIGLANPCPLLPAFNVYGYVGDGVGTGTASGDFSQATVANLIASFVVTPSAGNSVEVDVSSFVQSIISGSDTYAGFVLTTAGGNGVVFGDNYTLDSFQSTTVPLPAGLPLLLAGLSGLFLFRRRGPGTD